MRDVQLFFPVVHRGGMLVALPEDVADLRLGDALRRRVREIVDRPPRVGLRPPGAGGGDEAWREVRRHHHEAFGMAATTPRPDERHVVALAHGIGEVVAEAMTGHVFVGLRRIERSVERIARLSRPADLDPWAPSKKGRR